MKNLLFTICLLCSAGNILAQTADSLKFNNRKFKHEIGIDFRGIFNNTVYYGISNLNGSAENVDRGYSFIWKIRNDRGKLISISYIKNWRLQLRTSSSVNTAEVQRFESNGVTFEFRENRANSLFFQPSFGFERVNFFNRFNFYYGADFGATYYRLREASNFVFDINGGTYSFTTNRDSYGPDVTAFVGMKYRISDRFSVGLESGFGVFFRFVNARVYDNRLEKTASKATYESFGHSFYPLRLLTFNYHFKQF